MLDLTVHDRLILHLEFFRSDPFMPVHYFVQSSYIRYDYMMSYLLISNSSYMMNMFLNLIFVQIRFFYDCELLCQLQVLALFTNLTDLRSEIKSIRDDDLFFGLFFNVLSFVSLFPGCWQRIEICHFPPGWMEGTTTRTLWDHW